MYVPRLNSTNQNNTRRNDKTIKKLHCVCSVANRLLFIVQNVCTTYTRMHARARRYNITIN